MLTIKENITNTIIIKNSKFITLLYRVNNIEDTKKYLTLVKDEYKNATHYCYAYIIDNYKRFNDDGEPDGSAGMPILEVLEKNKLNYVLCIVIRYFGGIKLGVGGLIRAYSNATKEAIEKANIITLKIGYNVTITFSYSLSKQVDYLLKNTSIIEKQFANEITYTVLIDNDTLNLLKNLNIYIKINKEILI